METEILEQIGLTKTEIKVYLTLLETGQSTTTNVIKESGIYASKIYEFLNKLIKKGLVSYTIKSNKKYFSASSPESLIELLKDKQNSLNEQKKSVNKLIPELNSLRAKKKESIHSEVYEGANGVKLLYKKILDTLEKNEIQYIIGGPREGNELFEGFLLDWHKKRIKKGIKCKYIYNSNVRDYGKIREQMPLSEVKYLPDEANSPVWIEIFGDYVATGHIKGYGAIIFLVKDKEIAKGYLNYFNLLWKLAKK